MADSALSTINDNFYLRKYGFNKPEINEVVSSDLGIVVVIPCHREKQLIQSLESLNACDKPNCSVEIIVVINASENSAQAVLQKNEQTYREALAWSKNTNNERLKFHFLVHNNLPKKHAGVGLARKIGMDEAVARFHSINHDGIIVCFDADSVCEKNYLQAIEKHFEINKKSTGCSIHFEHPTQGDEFTEEIYNGIVDYELFLRYYRQGLKFAGLPYAYHTIGSSMAVKSSVYQKQGGMNRRKAGEDFYFLHKIIELGNFSEIEETKIIPSPRPSDRVPFGTGRAIESYLSTKVELEAYHFQVFYDLKEFVTQLHLLYDRNIEAFLSTIPNTLSSFLSEENMPFLVDELHRNSNSEDMFFKRLFKWFNAFKVLKFVHYVRDNFYDNIKISGASIGLLGLEKKEFANNKEILDFYRQIDKTL